MGKLYNQKCLLNFQKDLRKKMTKSEVVVWKCLKAKQLGFKFRRQFGVGNYIVDFYCPELKLAVEIDGLTHGDERVFDNDVKRQKFLEKVGIKVRRYSSEQVLKNLDEVVADIYGTCCFLSGTSP